jgi:hypothetical protein
MADALVVPIRVEALPVGTRDRVGTIAPYADFGAVAGPYAPYVGAQVANRLFGGGRPLEPGVHLHWHLPRALRSVPLTAERPEPPAAPDRWLVTRVDGRRQARHWIVESNHLDDEPRYSDTSFPGDVRFGERPFSYLGRVYALEDWLAPGQEGGRHLAGLTGLGYGIADFAGSYANCRNVFGLHDEPVGPSRLTYTVIGWHDDPGDDPLRRGELPAGWTLPAGAPQPERTLYFGAIRDVPFDPAGAHLAEHEAPAAAQVAIGNTPAEALAALAADGTQQRLFTAFQIGALRRPGDLAGVEEQVHAAGFASVDAGVTWELRTTGGDGVAGVDARATRHLSRLNLRQRAYDVLRAELTALRRRIFADWCRRAELRAARWRPDIDLDGLDELIERQIAELHARERELARIAAVIDRRRRAVRFHLPDDVELVPSAAPRYYRPNDPVVVLTGDGVSAPPPDLSEQVVCALASTLPEPPETPGFEALTRLTHPEPAQLARLGAFADRSAEGLPAPEIALRTWSLPWRPVELAWRVTLQLPAELESGRPLAPGFVLDGYTLHERVLDFDPCEDAFDGMPDEYEGRAPLAANATAALERQLGAVLDAGLLERLHARPIVAQSLGGFTQALGMLDPGLQLPVADPYGSPLDAPFVQRVVDAVAGEGSVGPLPDNPFAPLRCGRFTLSALRLVDEFGRWRDVPTDAVAVAETIPRDGEALLPPLRLTQAAQLRWRWRIAGRAHTEASSAPDGSPVCGWVVTNRLDSGIVLYDRDGSALARFAPGPDGTAAETAPGPERPTLEAALARANPVLVGLARRLLGAAREELEALTRTVDAARATIAPPLTSADREIAVLLGTPLALVQAELDLSLLGLPLIDMSYRALADDIRSADPLARADRGVPGIRFGVRLGNRGRADDGLVGFFVSGADGAPDFGTFYCADGAEDGALRRPSPDTITVTADPASPPVVVTMLIDPRCPVHAATGILPVKSLAIPGDLVTRGLAALEYTFLTGPLLVSGAVGAPAPAAAAGWRWVDRGGAGHAWREHELAPAETGLPPSGRQRIVDGWLKLGERRAR